MRTCVCMCENTNVVGTHAMLPMWVPAIQFPQLQNALTESIHIHAKDPYVFLTRGTHTTLMAKEVNLRNAPNRA